MIGSFIENALGQIVAPDPKAPAATSNPPNPILQIIAPDPKYYANLQSSNDNTSPPSPSISRSKEVTPPSFSTPETKSTMNNQSNFDPSALASQIMSAAMGTANTLSSPVAVWEDRKTIFTQLTSTSLKSAKKLSRLLKKNPDLAIVRCANCPPVPDGFTPLHTAAMFNNIEAAKLLLTVTDAEGHKLVSCQTTDLQGRTPLHVAAERGFVDLISFFRQRLAMETGADPVGEKAPVDLAGRTPLAWAVTSKHASAVTHRERVRDELFSPGDHSICPRTPATQKRQRLRVSPLEWGMAEMPGWRVDMEDASLADVTLQRGVFGVFDGHGDQGRVSDFLKQNLAAVWDTVSANGVGVTAAMTDTCQILDNRLRTKSLKGGSTGIIAIVQNEEIIVANVGDSRAILVQKSVVTKEGMGDVVVLPLSHDHKPSNPAEKLRIETAGLTYIEETSSDGQVFSKVQLNDDTKLALSRAFGDFDFKNNAELAHDQQALISVPDVVVRKRDATKDLFLVLACDGIWDVMSNDQCGQFVYTLYSNRDSTASLDEIADSLLRECLLKGSEDNMSVVIVDLNTAKNTPDQTNSNSTSADVGDVVAGMKKLNFEDE